MIKQVTIVGAGTMGNGIAHVFAQNSFAVTLADINQAQLDKALANINKNLDRPLSKGTINDEQKAATLANITTSSVIAESVSNAELVVEAATENTELKLSIFKEIDASAPINFILASNTSSISITKIAAVTNRPDKVIGMHFMNPVPVMKLVEIINGYSTAKEVTNVITELSKHLN